jgi:UDP-N-acetylglucosamine transferase subunit ALG13
MGVHTYLRRTGTQAPASAAPHVSVSPDTPRSLLVASSGGHLSELRELADRLPLLGVPLWVTFETPQARSLLADDDVAYVHATGPRDLRNTLRNIPVAQRLLREHNVVEVISTGAAVAVTFLPLARLHGIDAHYIESAARSHAPSVTGRLMARTPGVHCYSQYQRWASGTWRYAGSILDRFVTLPVVVAAPPERPLRVVVALGTQQYRFDRLVDAVRAIAEPNWSITWQHGPNDYGELAGDQHGVMESESFEAACRDADLVIGQAGVGTALAALEGGTVPILVPRDAAHHEHVDDHQSQIADELASRGLAITATPAELTRDVVRDALTRRVVMTDDTVPFQLVRQ